MNFKTYAFRLYSGSKIYIQSPMANTKDVHSKYPINSFDIDLNPQAIVKFCPNQNAEYYLIGPVDFVFKADKVNLSWDDLSLFFKQIINLEFSFSNRIMPTVSENIEKYLFMCQGKLRLAVPLIFEDKFPFKNSLQIFKRLIVLMPRYKNWIEKYLVSYDKHFETLITTHNSNGKPLCENRLKFLNGLHQAYSQNLNSPTNSLQQNRPIQVRITTVPALRVTRTTAATQTNTLSQQTEGVQRNQDSQSNQDPPDIPDSQSNLHLQIIPDHQEIPDPQTTQVSQSNQDPQIQPSQSNHSSQMIQESQPLVPQQNRNHPNHESPNNAHLPPKKRKY